MANNLIVARNGRWVLASNGAPVLIVRSLNSATSFRLAFPSFDPPITDTVVVEQGDIGKTLFICRCGEWAAVGVKQQRCGVCGRTYRLRVEEQADGT